MRNLKYIFTLFVITIMSGLIISAQTSETKKDVPYVPTQQSVVEGMLNLAKVSKDDIVYDLGCGDGRIVITSAKLYGTSGVGVDIDPERIKEANENAKKEGVEEKVSFIEGDLFKQDFSKATVITLYLLPEVNLRLRPILLEQLKPGTRIVSHAFSMGDWEPEQTIEIDGATIYLWTVPEKQ